ncbi:hypothetical protein ACWAUC_12830 [Bradyrhizobium guangdongense]
MDEDFIKGRAEHIRELATKADPFTKKRLIELADSYERRLRSPPYASERPTPRLQPQTYR